MLDDNRIREAERNTRDYLQTGLLRKHDFRKDILDIYLNNSFESIEVAGFLAENKRSDLWVIVTSYYAMFYMANAALFKAGYKVGDKISHKVTADALIIFIRDKLQKRLLEEYEEAIEEALPGLKADTLIEDFEKERKKRGLQYETTPIEKRAKAKTSLERAKRFLFEMEKTLYAL